MEVVLIEFTKDYKLMGATVFKKGRKLAVEKSEYPEFKWTSIGGEIKFGVSFDEAFELPFPKCASCNEDNVFSEKLQVMANEGTKDACGNIIPDGWYCEVCDF